MNACPLCGVDKDVWGKNHICRPGLKPIKPEPPKKLQEKPTVGSTDDLPHRRYKDKESRRTYMKAYMAKRRKKTGE